MPAARRFYQTIMPVLWLALAPGTAMAGPAVPGTPAVPSTTSGGNDYRPWTANPPGAPAPTKEAAPATDASPTARTYGPQYYKRQGEAGPAQRGRAYDVRPTTP